MKKNLLGAFAGTLLLAGTISAQTFDRRAEITNRGPQDRGTCTVRVVVDGAAEISIHGDHATLKDLSGSMPHWQSFQCSSPMPADARDIRLQPVEGRGRVQMIQNTGREAVIRIEDPEGGASQYAFNVTWEGPYREGPPPPVVSQRFTTDQAIETCRREVRTQAFDRFGTDNVDIRNINIDNNPGRNDWVTGVVDVHRGYYGDARGERARQGDAYRFSCSVNFDNGRVRSVSFQPVSENVGQAGTGRAIDNCRSAVRDRIRSDGFDRPDVTSIHVDDRPGRNDWIVGTALGERYGRRESFDFSCSVELRDGDLRSVDVSRR